MKKLILSLSLLLATSLAFADVSGNGCKIGQGYVYTEYLGMAPAYTGTQPIPIYWGYGFNQHQGYKCGYINVYGASSYYDHETKQNVPIPAENEFTRLGPQCVIAPSLGAQPVSTDSYVSYSYMKTSKCNTTPVPIDDNAWFLLIGSALPGAIFLRTKLFYFQR